MPALAGTRPRDGARPQAQRLSRSSRSSRTGANSWGWPARVGAQEVDLPRVRVDANGGGERHRVEGAGEVNGQDAHPATGSGIVSLAPLLRRMGMPRSKAWLWLGLSLYVAAMAAGLATDTDDFKALAELGVVLLWCGLLAEIRPCKDVRVWLAWAVGWVVLARLALPVVPFAVLLVVLLSFAYRGFRGVRGQVTTPPPAPAGGLTRPPAPPGR